MTQKIDISIIIPFLNEADNIPNLVTTLNNFCSKSDFSFEIIFVDDGSTDGSIEIFKNQEFNSFDSKIIKLSQNYGSHAALRSGIYQARGTYIGFLYADLQDPVELIEKMYIIASKKQKNIVWASRKSTKIGFFETIFSQMYSWLMKKYVSKKFPLKGFDIVLFDRKIQQELNKNIESNSSIFLQIITMGFDQESIEYDKSERKVGKSKWTLKKKIKLFIDSFVAFSYFPIRMVSLSGIAFFLLGVTWSVYLIARKLIVDDLQSGWPALVSILMIGFGVTNISLGVVAEYLWRTLDASRKRPVFIVDEVIHLNSIEE